MKKTRNALLALVLSGSLMAAGTTAAFGASVKTCDSGTSGPFTTETTQKGSCKSSHEPVEECANPAGKTDTNAAHCD